jgi:hypothetical protein
MAIAIAITGKPPIVVDAETITIGSDPGSTVVLADDARIKPRHAVIRKVEGLWRVEARDADSIQVGRSAPGRVHSLNPGDIIRLTAKGPEITFQPPRKRAAPGAAQSRSGTKSALIPVPAGNCPAPPPAQTNPPADAVPPPAVQAPRPPADAGDTYELNIPLIEETPEIRPVPLPSRQRAGLAASRKPAPAPAALAFAGGVTAAGLLAAAAWFWFGRGDSRHERESTLPPANAVTSLKKEPPAAVEKAEVVEEVAAIVPPAEPKSKPKAPQKTLPSASPPATPVTRPAPVDAERCLYTVLAVDSDRQRQFRLGTAWAASPRLVVTSAAVIMGIEELQRSGLRAAVSPAGAMREIRVRGMRVNPLYRQAVARASAIRGEKDTVPVSPPSAFGAPPVGPRGNVLNNNPQAMRQMLNDVCWTQVRFDIGVLELDEAVADVLPVPAGPSPSRPDDPLVMAGLPFKLDEISPADLASASRPERFSGLTSPGSSTAGSFFHLEFASELEDRNWSGSPILNEAGQVVGVYSRSTTAFEGAAPGPATHAIVSTLMLRELAADLLK